MLYDDCCTSQLMFHLVATRSSNDVLNIVSFMHCLQVEFSQSPIILQCLNHLWWPIGVHSSMALIEVAIDI
jgi:hypothetical protein